jgi:hypothetical protein
MELTLQELISPGQTPMTFWSTIAILTAHDLMRAARRQPIFAFADMRRASAKRVKWGISDHRDSPARFLADFRHTALNGADLTEAQICG